MRQRIHTVAESVAVDAVVDAFAVENGETNSAALVIVLGSIGQRQIELAFSEREQPMLLQIRSSGRPAPKALRCRR